MKKILVSLIAIMTVCMFASCGNTGKNEIQSENNQQEQSVTPEGKVSKETGFSTGVWPDNDWTKKVPKPTVGTVGEIETMGSKDQTLSIGMTWTHEEAAAYCDEILKAGNFTKESYTYYKDAGTKSLSVLLEAKSTDGWEVAVTDKKIRIVKP